MSSDPLQQRVPYSVSPPRYSVSHQMVTTAFELPNYRLVQNLGVVRGIVVRSRNIFATIGASLQTIVGGNITVWTRLCEQTRADAFDIMIQHATELGANAVVGARYDTTELSTGVTEVLAYGTAVVVEPLNVGESYRS
ncbi:MAG: YbjQ family protein [Pyrinomonadaceae bacterium]